MSNETNIKWYLRDGWFLFFIAFLTPIGILIFLINHKNLTRKQKINRYLWVFVFSLLWSLNFIPKTYFIYLFILIIVLVISIFITIIFFTKKEK